MSGYTGIGRDALIATIQRLTLENNRLHDALTAQLVEPLLYDWRCTHCGARADIDLDVGAIPHVGDCPLAMKRTPPTRVARPAPPRRLVTKADA